MPFILAHAVYALKCRTVYGEYILMFLCTYQCLKVLRIATHTIMVYDSLGKCNANEASRSIKEWLSLWSNHVWREIDATLIVSCN